MPLYEYQCASCQRVHEVVQKFSDLPMKECPDCKGAVSKLVSMSSFALKGSGWYTTDYKKKSSAPASESAPVATPAAPAATAAPSTAASATTAPSTAAPVKTAKA